MTTILDRYIFRRALRSTLSAAGGLVGVVWTVEAVQRLDVLLTKGQGILTYLKMTTLGVPLLAAAVLPVALLIGVMQTVSQLNQDSEHVVLHASGASSRSLLRPLLALALLLSVLTYVLQLSIAPSAMRELRNMVTQVRADLVSVIVQEGTFHPVSGGLTLHVGRRLPGGGLEGLLIQDRRDPDEAITYTARSGTIAEDGSQTQARDTYLLLSDGSIQRARKGEGRVSVISFQSYAFSLSSFTGGGRKPIYKRMETPTSELISPDPENPLYKRSPARFAWELHGRLTGGLWPFVVVLACVAFLAVPVSNRDRQMGTAVGLVLAVVVLRGTTITAEASLREWEGGTPILWAVPLLAILAFAALIRLDRRPGMPGAAERRLRPRIEAIVARVERLRERILPGAAGTA